MCRGRGSTPGPFLYRLVCSHKLKLTARTSYVYGRHSLFTVQFHCLGLERCSDPSAFSIFAHRRLVIRDGDAKYLPDLHSIADLSISIVRHKDKLLFFCNKTVVPGILLH